MGTSSVTTGGNVKPRGPAGFTKRPPSPAPSTRWKSALLAIRRLLRKITIGALALGLVWGAAETFLAEGDVEASTNGAAVVWVPYDNRLDFRLAPKLLKLVLADGAASPFRIPERRYFTVDRDAPFSMVEEKTSRPSFQRQMRAALASIAHVPDPHLVIAIASHGAIGTLNQQANSGVRHDRFVKLVAYELEHFKVQTSRDATLSLYYGTCHADSISAPLRAALRIPAPGFSNGSSNFYQARVRLYTSSSLSEETNPLDGVYVLPRYLAARWFRNTFRRAIGLMPLKSTNDIDWKRLLAMDKLNHYNYWSSFDETLYSTAVEMASGSGEQRTDGESLLYTLADADQHDYPNQSCLRSAAGVFDEFPPSSSEHKSYLERTVATHPLEWKRMLAAADLTYYFRDEANQRHFIPAFERYILDPKLHWPAARALMRFKGVPTHIQVSLINHAFDLIANPTASDQDRVFANTFLSHFEFLALAPGAVAPPIFELVNVYHKARMLDGNIPGRAQFMQEILWILSAIEGPESRAALTAIKQEESISGVISPALLETMIQLHEALDKRDVRRSFAIIHERRPYDLCLRRRFKSMLLNHDVPFLEERLYEDMAIIHNVAIGFTSSVFAHVASESNKMTRSTRSAG